MQRYHRLLPESEGKMDVSAFNDPEAGIHEEEDIHLDSAVEAEMQKAITATHDRKLEPYAQHMKKLWRKNGNASARHPC